MMSALQLAKMAFNHQNSPHITIWTDYEAVYKRLTFDDWECPTNSASTSFLPIARQLYLLNKHRLSIRWQNSHPEQKYDKKTKDLKRAKKTISGFNYGVTILRT
jgi:hypothetical protein